MKKHRVVILVDEPQLVAISNVYLEETGKPLQVSNLIDSMLHWKFQKVGGIDAVDMVDKVNFGRSDWQILPNYLPIGTQLNELGFTAERIRPKANGKERGIEVGIACWLWENQHRYDTVFIISGDSDLAQVLVTLRNKRKQVHYVNFKYASQELDQIVQGYDMTYLINKNAAPSQITKNPFKTT